MGRKKIQIEKIDCAIKRRATFNKRSRGILKKAKELALLCDVDVGLVIFSPAGKSQHFSNRPWIEQVLQQFNDNTQGNEAGMCSDNKEECKNGCCGTNPSSSLQSAHGHISMQQPQLLEAPHVREQVHMQGFPFVEMGYPSSSFQTSVFRQCRSSEVRGPQGAPDYMQDPLDGRCGIPFSSNVQSSSLWGLRGVDVSKLEHFSNWPGIEQELQRFNANIIPTKPEEHIANLQVSGTNPSNCVQSAHEHISMQQPQVLEAPECREQVPMHGVQGVPFVEMGDPSLMQISVSGRFRSSEIRGPDGASDYMQGPPVGGCDMSFFSSVRPSLPICDLPEEETGKLEHFSNQSSLQVSENVHMQVPIQHTQEDETGMCPDDGEGWASLLQSYLLESADPSLSSQQIETSGANPSSLSSQQVEISGTNLSSDVQSEHGHILMQQPQVFEALQGKEQAQMDGVSLVEMEDPSSTETFVPGQFASSEGTWPYGASDFMLRQPSPPGVGWEMPLYGDEDIFLATLRKWSADENE